MLVDFHVHSQASDGTFSPTELAEKSRHFEAIALTDHDNCDGVEEFLAADGCRKVAGIELSIEAGEGFDKFHLLGLGIDPKDAGLNALLERVLVGRNERNERIIARFLKLGIDLGGEIFSYAHGKVLARPHFANWLVDHGYAKDKYEAFDHYLVPDAPECCYEERWHPTQEEAFAAVHGAGGICVMAHPKFWCDTWKDFGCDFAAAERELRALRDRGLDGVEALYQANTPEENAEFTRIATSLGYLKTAGSDFHGTNKPKIPLGMEVKREFIAPTLARLW